MDESVRNGFHFSPWDGDKVSLHAGVPVTDACIFCRSGATAIAGAAISIGRSGNAADATRKERDMLGVLRKTCVAYKGTVRAPTPRA